MAVSVSRARSFNQFLCFVCVLYLSPFCSSWVSLLVNWISMLFMTLGWNVHVTLGVIVCVLIRLVNLLSSVLYFFCASLWSFSSIVCWIYGHVLFQVFARFKCR
jgi:hypothetical protein